jgi:hypothetical protein
VNEPARRTVLIAGAIVLGLLSIGAGALIAVTDDARAGRSPTAAATPTETPTPTATPTDEPTATAEPSPTPDRVVLDDGTYFVYVTDASRRADGSIRVTFDLAYFYTGADAVREAAERGEEPVNDYYIQNDNPRLRTMPVASDAGVRYLPVGSASTELVDGDLDAWLDAVLETNPTDYGGKDVPWWFTTRDGVVTRIEQQYLP